MTCVAHLFYCQVLTFSTTRQGGNGFSHCRSGWKPSKASCITQSLNLGFQLIRSILSGQRTGRVRVGCASSKKNIFAELFKGTTRLC